MDLNSGVDYDCAKLMMKEKFGENVREFEELDGVKVYLKNMVWIMVRSSGTENRVRVYVESRDESRANLLLEEGVGIAMACSKAKW